MEDYYIYLSQVMEFEATGQGKHEWLFDKKSDAVKVANYLRRHGYKVKFRATTSDFLKDIGCGYYVGVPSRSL